MTPTRKRKNSKLSLINALCIQKHNYTKQGIASRFLSIFWIPHRLAEKEGKWKEFSHPGCNLAGREQDGRNELLPSFILCPTGSRPCRKHEKFPNRHWQKEPGRRVSSRIMREFEDEEEQVVEQVEPVSKKKRKRRKLPRPHFQMKKKTGLAEQDLSRAETPILSATPAKVIGKSAPPLDEEKTEREQLMESLESASTIADQFAGYEVPSNQLLERRAMIDFESQESEVRQNARILEKTFKEFGFNVKVVDIETGPVIAQYEIELEAGLRLSKITSLSDDIAIALRVPSVRIVAPIPGKNSVGIEVPNGEQQLVRMREGD